MRPRTFLSVALAATFCSALSALGAVTGTVINSDGAPVSGAKVSLFAPETLTARRARLASKNFERTALATMTTGQNGSFSLDSPKGEPLLDLNIVAAGFAPSGTRVVPNEDVGAQPLVAAPVKSGTISANGKPLPGATVIWIGVDSELQLVTDANGKYSVPDPEKWANLLVVMHPDYAPIEEIVASILGKKPLDRTLTTGVVVKGRVMSADGTAPVAKATVLIDNWPSATSGDDGSFAIPHARKEWKELAALAGDRAATHAHATTDVTMKLGKAPTISGVVRDARTQQPVAGVELRLGAPGPTSITAHTVFSDAKGNFSFGSIPAGMYMLNANRPGFSTLPLNVAPKAGQALQKNVYLNERARVTGTVVDEDKRAVAGTHLTARSGGRGMNMFMIVRGGLEAGPTAAGPDGHFVMRSVEPGSEVVIDATKRAMPAARSSMFKVAAGETKNGVTIVIPRGVAFAGKVTDGNGKPVSGVAIDASAAENEGGPLGGGTRMVRRMVNLAQRGNSDDQLVRTGSDGAFSLKLKEGKYDVAFKREGFANKLLRAQEVSRTSKPVEVKLDPGVEITGRVSRGGMPVEGVNVAAIGEDGLSNTQTMPDGTFRVTDLTPGQYMVSINKMDSFIQTMRTVSAPAQNINVELPGGGRISGHVVDKDSHQPVTSFQAGVTTSRSGGGMMIMSPPMTRQFTSDDGSFTLENVPPGPVQLVVNAPGYTSGHLSGLTIEDGKSLNDVEVDLDTGVRLVGRVTGPDGSPLSGVAVREDMTPGARGRMNLAMGDGGALTDPNGEYAIDSLEPGEMTFTFNRNGYLGDSKTVNLSSKETRLDVQLSSGQAAGGQVVSDAGGPVADATVSAQSAAEGFGQRNVHTDASGSFQFEGLAPGHYTFTATKNGYAQGVLRDFDISSGAPARIVMSTGGIITGHVTGLSGQDLTTATVIASGTNGNASAPVDASGNFRIDGAPLGTVHISARTGQMFGGTAKASAVKTIEVDPGSAVTADLEFKSGTVISGHVTRAGQPLANANLGWFGRGNGMTTRSSVSTDSSGSYSIDSLEDGAYTVQVNDMDLQSPYTTQYTVSGSGTFDINIVGAAVHGRVLNSNGEPVNEATVQVNGKGTEGMFSSRAAPTDSNGNFTLASVAPGSYTASVQKSGYGNDPHDITVSTSDVEVNFTVAQSDGLTIRVVDARDQRMLAAFAQAYDSAGRQADPNNFFRGFGSVAPITLSVSPGAYRVTISAIGYATQTVNLQAPNSNVVVPLTPGGGLLIHTKTPGLSANLIDSTGHVYLVSTRGLQGIFPLDTTSTGTVINNIAAGTYTLQVLNGASVVSSTPVNITEGGMAQITI
jgi:protocatechuate 3,4-dioxygenase beta subunit